MKTSLINRFPFYACALSILLMTGCSDSGKIVPVSGIVTLNGEPIANVEVVFEPLPTEETSNVGPFSLGVTDASGKYTLETRYGDPGAVIGKHRVYFQFAGFDPEAASEARALLREAEQAGNDRPEGVLSDLKEAEKQKRIPGKYGEEKSEIESVVPAGGTDAANFDL